MNNKTNEKSLKHTIQYMLGLLWFNVKAFFKHPIKYVKAYVRDFIAADAKSKAKKILMTAVGLYVCYIAASIVVGLFLAAIVIAAVLGSADYEVAVGRFIDRHGREPENSYELENDIY